MSCNCKKDQNPDQPAVTQAVAGDWVYQTQREEKIRPTDQCVSCAQKHFDEAFIAFSECGYEEANRRFVRGSLRAVVLHTFREWPEIGKLARECALLVQEARDKEAAEKMELLGSIIDAEFYKANPEVKERLDKLKEQKNHDNSYSNPFGTRELQEQ